LEAGDGDDAGTSISSGGKPDDAAVRSHGAACKLGRCA